MTKIKNFLSGTRYLIGFFLFKHREYVSILIAFLLYLVITPLSRLIDPTASPVDPGYLTAIVMAIIAILVFKFTTWRVLKSLWPVFVDYSKDHFERNFKVLTPCQKVLIYLGFYSLLFGYFIVALRAFV